MRLNESGDTITAIATPIGESGIGIVRLSGSNALKVADKIFVSRDNRKPSGFKAYTTHYGWITDGQKTIDEVILTVMRAPKSYTKEDIVEINCHGGIVALRAMLELVLSCGCRLAEPGEFTKRAFLNGRIDLVQAEAVLDIIRAKTDSALTVGLEQLKGALSKEIMKMRKILLDILAPLEANIDFPEEQTGGMDTQALAKELNSLDALLKGILESSKRARLLREGVQAVICGKPNAGKSSLLNAVLKRERSIVTPVAGTTRDTIEEIIDIRGIPVRIVDTAGIIEPKDLIEKKAVERSKRAIKAADIILLVLDGSKGLEAVDRMLLRKVKDKRVIVVINKCDLKVKLNKKEIARNFGRAIEISAKRSRNLNLLEEEIVKTVYQGSLSCSEPLLVSNLRHIEGLRGAQKFIAEALNSLDNKLPVEFVAQNVKDALGCLDDILGLSFPEDLLDDIFGKFCIGK
jgi:tRNA modification GTPase